MRLIQQAGKFTTTWMTTKDFKTERFYESLPQLITPYITSDDKGQNILDPAMKAKIDALLSRFTSVMEADPASLRTGLGLSSKWSDTRLFKPSVATWIIGGLPLALSMFTLEALRDIKLGKYFALDPDALNRALADLMTEMQLSKLDNEDYRSEIARQFLMKYLTYKAANLLTSHEEDAVSTDSPIDAQNNQIVPLSTVINDDILFEK